MPPALVLSIENDSSPMGEMIVTSLFVVELSILNSTGRFLMGCNYCSYSLFPDRLSKSFGV